MQRLARPAFRDALVAIALALLVVAEITTTDVAGPMALLVPLGLGATLPLAARRRAPVVVLVVVLASLIALDRLSEVQEPQVTLLPILVATFSVGAYAPRRPAVLGLGIALAAVLADQPDDFVVMGPLFAATWLVGRLLRSHTLQAARLAAMTEVLEREQAENARLAIEHERVRIARELHDVVAHSVSVIVVQAGAERMALGEERSSTREVLREIERTGREALAEMRRLVGVLRRDGEVPDLAPQPSLKYLDDLVKHVERAGLAVELSVEGDPVELVPSLDVSSFRIIQEALTNTLKHAGPARATVTVRYGDRRLELEIDDDGAGTPSLNGVGHGLIGMRERVALHGGELEVDSSPGGGFTVRASLPLERASS
jgi:signal transduction histidine kinase